MNGWKKFFLGPVTVPCSTDPPTWSFGAVTYTAQDLQGLGSALSREVAGYPPLTAVLETVRSSTSRQPSGTSPRGDRSSSEGAGSSDAGREADVEDAADEEVVEVDWADIGGLVGRERDLLRLDIRCGRYPAARLSLPARGPGRFETVDQHPYPYLPQQLRDRWPAVAPKFGTFNRSEYAAPRRPWAFGYLVWLLLSYVLLWTRPGSAPWEWIWPGLLIAGAIPAWIHLNRRFGKNWQQRNEWTDSEQDSIKLVTSE